MDIWVKESGFCEAPALREKARAFAASEDYVIAYYPDRFLVAAANQLSSLPAFETLLELRLFNEGRELWAHRSTLGKPFSWRIADDAELIRRAAEEEDPELRLPQNHYLDTWQTLDIDTTANLGTNEYGSRRLRSTVGGSYALPVGENDGCVKIRSYVRYDENGVAAIADYRLLGFGPQKRG